MVVVVAVVLGVAYSLSERFYLHEIFYCVCYSVSVQVSIRLEVCIFAGCFAKIREKNDQPTNIESATGLFSTFMCVCDVFFLMSVRFMERESSGKEIYE